MSPADGTIWGSVLGFPGSIVHVIPGANPTLTALAEVYELPWNNPKAPIQGYSPRGLDIDTNGVVWTVLSSGHFASFDRRKCKGPLNGPTATGQHCPEGWTMYPSVPQPKGVTETGVLRPVIMTGSTSSIPSGSARTLRSRPAMVRMPSWRCATGQGDATRSLSSWVLRQGSRWPHRRREDRMERYGPWSTYGTRAPFHTETGKGTLAKVVKFQRFVPTFYRTSERSGKRTPALSRNEWTVSRMCVLEYSAANALAPVRASVGRLITYAPSVDQRPRLLKPMPAVSPSF